MGSSRAAEVNVHGKQVDRINAMFGCEVTGPKWRPVSAPQTDSSGDGLPWQQLTLATMYGPGSMAILAGPFSGVLSDDY